MGLQIEKIEPKRENGRHYSIKRVDLSSVTSVSSEAPNHKALMTDDKMTMPDDKTAGTSVSPANGSVSSACNPCNSAVPDDTANTDDKKPLFEDGWVVASHEEIPPEFLKPTPPPAPQQEQLAV